MPILRDLMGSIAQVVQTTLKLLLDRKMTLKENHMSNSTGMTVNQLIDALSKISKSMATEQSLFMMRAGRASVKSICQQRRVREEMSGFTRPLKQPLMN